MSSTFIFHKEMRNILDSKVNLVVREYGKKLRSKWRKIVTGQSDTRIRDHLIEHQEEPSYIKFFDKIGFTFGVLNIFTCQYFLLNQAMFFWLWYSAVIPLLLLSRFISFKKKSMQYFLLDFCYFTIFCSFLNLFFFYKSSTFFKVCFLYANGPVGWAIVVWRCSLVFHDHEKMTSLYIHILPAMLFFTLRWNNASECWQQPLQFADIFFAILGYIIWQAFYFVKTECIDREKLDRNPMLQTSLRYLTTDLKNGAAMATLNLCRKLGLFRRDEFFDATSMKTKIIFMSTQLVYTVLTILFGPLLYSSSIMHFMFLLFLFTVAVYNGGDYYIEVFSARYQLQFEKQQQIQKVAQVAAEVAYELAEQRGRSGRSSVHASSARLAEDVVSAIATEVAAAETEPVQSPNEFDSQGDQMKFVIGGAIDDLGGPVPVPVPGSIHVDASSGGADAQEEDEVDEEEWDRVQDKEVIQAATSAFVQRLLLDESAGDKDGAQGGFPCIDASFSSDSELPHNGGGSADFYVKED